MRIVFFGSPPFAEDSFGALLERDPKPVALVTAPPRRAGRGRKEVVNPLVVAAEQADVPVLRPASARNGEFLDQLRALEPDLGVVVSYGQILSDELLATPKFGCINVHGSLLPRWRGASPVQAAILAGDQESGVCVQKMVAALDAGAVLAERSVVLSPDERAFELFDRLKRLGAELLADFLDQVGDGPLPAGEAQDENAVTFCKRIRPLDGRISWQQTSTQIDRLVRAMAGWPWAQAQLPNGDAVRILRGEASSFRPEGDSSAGNGGGEHSVEAGQDGSGDGEILRLDGGIFVRCGEGVFRIDELQRAGKAALAAADFLRGRPLQIGEKLT